MKRKIEIDLTSLLDVILIILFALMIQMNQDTIQAKEISEDISQEKIQQQEIIKKMRQGQAADSQHIEQLKKQIKALEGILRDDSLAENLYKYEALLGEFYFLNMTVELVNGESPRYKVFVNEVDTGLFILSEDWYDVTKREGKIQAIYELIRTYLETNNVQLVLITYQHESDVYRFVSNIVDEAITKTQETYGHETTLKTEWTVDSLK